MKGHGLLYTIIFTFLVCFVFVFILSLTNNVTAAQVALNQRLSQQRAILSAMGIEFSSDNEVQRLFREIRQEQVGQETLYLATQDGTQIVAALFSGPGLWGTIRGVLALNGDGSRIVGLELISHNETPGLGGRIDESWYKGQLRGELVAPDGTIEMVSRRGVGDSDSENGGMDGITGATRTSESMVVILNNEIARVRNLIIIIGEIS